MKKTFLVIVAVAASMISVSAQKFTNNADSLGYYIGATQGAMLGNNIALEIDAKDLAKYKSEFLKGFKETLLADTSREAYRRGQMVGLNMTSEFRRMREAGQSADLKVLYDAFAKYFSMTGLTEEDYRPLYEELVRLMQPTQNYFKQKSERQQQEEMQKQQALVDGNIAAGKKFMDELKATDPDVKFTESGLGYKVIRQGEGEKIAADGAGMVRYVGKLVDGTQFDASGSKSYRLGPQGVIPGFGEGLMMMNKGSKYILYIPQELAYGLQGPPSIGPGQTLIFEVDVDEVINPQSNNQ